MLEKHYWCLSVSVSAVVSVVVWMNQILFIDVLENMLISAAELLQISLCISPGNVMQVGCCHLETFPGFMDILMEKKNKNIDF